jgi:hypothetical protein
VNAIAIGEGAGSVNQTANSICINATGLPVQTTTAGLYIDPIVAGPAIANPVPAATQFLTYDTVSKEITYRDGAGIGGGGGASYPDLVPIYRQLQPAPQTSFPITDNGAPAACELTAGGLSATVAQLYDPVAAAALGLSTVVYVQYWYSAGFGQGLGNIIFPAVPTALRVNDGTPGFGPLQLFYACDYSVNGAFPQAYLGNQGCYSTSQIVEMPIILAGERGFVGPAYMTNVSITVALDVAGLAPADTIQFLLRAYTQYPAQLIATDSPPGTREYLGQISVNTSMTRA